MEVTSIDAKIFFGIMELVAIVFFAYISNQIKYNVVLVNKKTSESIVFTDNLAPSSSSSS
jgi:hypothetical protein